jgi:hypothetical protein
MDLSRACQISRAADGAPMLLADAWARVKSTINNMKYKRSRPPRGSQSSGYVDDGCLDMLKPRGASGASAGRGPAAAQAASKSSKGGGAQKKGGSKAGAPAGASAISHQQGRAAGIKPATPQAAAGPSSVSSSSSGPAPTSRSASSAQPVAPATPATPRANKPAVAEAGPSGSASPTSQLVQPGSTRAQQRRPQQLVPQQQQRPQQPQQQAEKWEPASRRHSGRQRGRSEEGTGSRGERPSSPPSSASMAAPNRQDKANRVSALFCDTMPCLAHSS